MKLSKKELRGRIFATLLKNSKALGLDICYSCGCSSSADEFKIAGCIANVVCELLQQQGQPQGNDQAQPTLKQTK